MSNISELLLNNKYYIKVLNTAKQVGTELNIPVYLVGGAVRDLLLGNNKGKDIDLMVEKDSSTFTKELAKKLKVKTIISYEKFHTYKIPYSDIEIEIAAARKEIEDTIAGDKIVVYTYGLSPFSTECTALLDEVGAQYKKVELGLEWFLLDKEKSTLRTELLEMTGQSSLPHVFIDGKHVGGLFTGSADGSSPGLAGLKESGELKEMVA